MDDPVQSSRFRIDCDLDELADVAPWGEPGEHKLHWFGLTSGRFWIETSVGNPTEYSQAIQEAWSLPWKNPDYYVARIYEDLLEILPAILDPVPENVAARGADQDWMAEAERWRDSTEDQARWEQWYSATEWWHIRSLDMGYLQHAPRIQFWRVEDSVFIRWKADWKSGGIPMWAAPTGEMSIEAVAFEAEVLRFCAGLLSSMEKRVHTIRQNGWQRTDCKLDVEELAWEHETRRKLFERTCHDRRATDWQAVQVSLDILVELMRGPLHRV